MMDVASIFYDEFVFEKEEDICSLFQTETVLERARCENTLSDAEVSILKLCFAENTRMQNVLDHPYFKDPLGTIHFECLEQDSQVGQNITQVLNDIDDLKVHVDRVEDRVQLIADLAEHSDI